VETTSKKKLGRPKAIPLWQIEIARQFCDAKTHRGLQNWCYMTDAMRELGVTDRENPPKYKFAPSHKEIMNRTKELPMVLFQELGRLNPDDMHWVASEIDKRCLSVRDATKFVKQCRNGTKKRKYSQFELFGKLADVIDKYRETHEATTDQLSIAIESLLEIVSEKTWGVVDE